MKRDWDYYQWGRQTYVMGILNITPDSFSGDGLLQTGNPVRSALERGRRYVKAGAHILDVGGESTRPGASSISEQEELDRVIPVIQALVAADLDAVISVDTYKASVAEAALAAGANWINDVWGLRADEKMASVAARNHTPLIIMHNRSQPANLELQKRLGGRYIGIEYSNLIEDVKSELMASVAIARQAGVADDHLILDPGIGFGKSVEQNLELINRLDEICALGFPVLLGPSRKSFIGYTLNLPYNQRVEGTAASVAVGITRGADIIRVHDVRAMARVARMTDAIARKPIS